VAESLQNRNTLEIKIQSFVIKYGPEQLINWLDEFDNIISPNTYKLFRQLEKETCKIFGISYADMRRFSNTRCTDARRAICFIANNFLKLPIETIIKLLGNVSARSVNYYIKDVETWIEEPRMNRPFIDAYNKILKNFKIDNL